MRPVLRFALLLPFLSAICSGDQEASNVPHLAVDQYGRCYAKSIPSEQFGQAGITKVYLVEAGEDKLLHTFGWYASQLHIACNAAAPGKPTAVSIVRLGPWHRGHSANQEDLALAVYWGGELVASYSTLEISGTPEHVAASVSHYSVFRRAIGFEIINKEVDWNEYQFVLEGTDGQRVAFHAATGKRMAGSP